MIFRRYLRFLCWPALALLVATCPVRAQTVLYARCDGAMRLVKQVSNITPFVDNGTGKLVAAERRYVLRPVAEYLPTFVAVRDLRVRTSGRRLINSGAVINREFRFSADFESSITLDDVFVVLDLNSESAGHRMWVQGLGSLNAREPASIAIAVPSTDPVEPGKFRLHIFSGGLEVFNSQMPAPNVEHALAKMVRRRIKDVHDAAPQPYIGPAPEYPAALRKAKINGKAVVQVKITRTGRIVDCQLTSATNPAFGQTALAAARQWHFLPRVVDGNPVEATVEVPFVFNAVAAKAK